MLIYLPKRTIFSPVIKCPVVPVWDDMEANSTYNIVGTTINISCSVGSENTNSFLLSHCTSNGKWEPAFDGCKSKAERFTYLARNKVIYLHLPQIITL